MPLALGLSYALAYFVLSWRRFASFHAQIDLSYYLRLVWGLGHGYHDLPLVHAQHVLGLHLEPVLLPLVALSALGAPLVPLLLAVQAVAVAALCWPAYRLARRHLQAQATTTTTAAGSAVNTGAALCALAALLYPTVTVATLHDFHPVTLALAPLLGVIDALDQGGPAANRRAVYLGALALSCREDIALQLALVVLLAALRRHEAARLRTGLLGLALVAYFCVYVLLIQPRYLPPSGSYDLHFGALGQALGTTARSGGDLLLAATRHPLRLLAYLSSGDRLGYPIRLLWPVAFLPLFAPRYLIGALPIVAINLLSAFPRVRSIEAHYATAIVPFILGPALIGVGRATRRLALWAPRAPLLHRLPVALLLVLCFLSHVEHGASPLAFCGVRFAWRDYHDGPEAADLRAAIATVPENASVAARPGPLAHLAQRPRALSPPEYDDGLPVDVVVQPRR